MQLPAFDPTDSEAGWRILEDTTSIACHMQEQVLEEVLTKNADTEYLKGFIDGQPDKELFKKKVPLVDYEDIKPFIERIGNGEPSELISVEPITELIRSSGTSGGEQKMIPTTGEKSNRNAFFYNIAFAVLNKYIQGLKKGKRMYFLFMGPSNYTSGELVVRNAITSDFNDKKLRNLSFNWLDVLTSHDEVILCQDAQKSMYSQLLCGLVQRHEVVRVGTTFASTFLRVIKYLEENWQQLCSDIRTGQISGWITDPNCRLAVSLILNKPMPDLADAIEVVYKGKSWEGTIKKLWPSTKLVEVIVTGSMAQYIPKLEFYCGGIPLVSLPYACSEGLFGINMKPLCNPYDVSYTLLPHMAYYEFLPVDNHQSSNVHLEGGIVDLANVKIGQHYELVVTTFTGLYRYRVGDILMVTDFNHNSPQFKFVQRQQVVLSIDVDKTTEEDLFKAITKAMSIIEPLGFLLTDYTSYAEISSIPSHYVLFWELQMKEGGSIPEPDMVKMEQCCDVVEQSLDVMYRKLRNWRTLSPLEIRVVKPGTFNQLMDFFLSQGTSFSQYKTPKCIKSERAIKILNSSVVGRFSSKVLPKLPS
ncbi:hypothetical protein ACH5RR_003516 [Cinchona calisaya]|uniref:Indole-3-acetic acid-amido synthetase GH3.17-like n=1 Tax=Cinchona calisaya TaxID=153742 RepID=A0ABD3AV86_9GENT